MLAWPTIDLRKLSVWRRRPVSNGYGASRDWASFADVDPSAMGVGIEAMIAVRLRRHSRDLVDSFRAYVIELPEVRSVFHVTGGDDFLVHVAARDSDHLRDLALDSFTTRHEVDHIQTRLIFKYTPT